MPDALSRAIEAGQGSRPADLVIKNVGLLDLVTGAIEETGSGAGVGTTLNIPVPPYATGDVYLRAFDELIAPAAARFDPTWLIVSAGFDAHRDDPITDLGLTAGDYPVLLRRVLALVPAGRRLVILEGGYDLDALANCSAAALREMAGLEPVAVPGESATTGGPGVGVVQHVFDHWREHGWL